VTEGLNLPLDRCRWQQQAAAPTTAAAFSPGFANVSDAATVGAGQAGWKAGILLQHFFVM